MRFSLRMTALAAALFVCFDVQNVLAQQQNRIQCDFKTWVNAWLANKWNAGSVKDELALTVCHIKSDPDYCRASIKFKDLVKSMNKSYLNALTAEVLPSKVVQNPALKDCELCPNGDLYQTIAKGDNSIQTLCTK